MCGNTYDSLVVAYFIEHDLVTSVQSLGGGGVLSRPEEVKLDQVQGVELCGQVSQVQPGAGAHLDPTPVAALSSSARCGPAQLASAVADALS